MPTFRIWMYGQSNMVWLNNTTPGFPAAEIMVPILRQLVDPAQAEAVIATQYDQTGTCFSGIGSAFENTAMTLQADGFHGTAGAVSLVRPRAPSDPLFTDWASWPLTTNGQSRITYAAGLPAATKAEISCILAMHSEYDSRGYGVNGWARNDPRVVEFAWRRMLGALRAALGKTAAQLPVLACVPVPYVPASDAGFVAVNQAINNLASDQAFNLRIVCEQAMDMTWDRDGPPGAYTWHANNADVALLCRRFARGIARAMGAAWAPNAYRSHPAGMGPRAIAAQWIDPTTIDVWVAHDGGNTLTLPATPTLGWAVTCNGRAVPVAGVSLPAPGRIRLTLGDACLAAERMTVAYAAGAARLLPGGAITDNSAVFDPKCLAAGVTGADRINGALRRTRAPLPVRRTAP